MWYTTDYLGVEVLTEMKREFNIPNLWIKSTELRILQASNLQNN
jgi:hypothetical protein